MLTKAFSQISSLGPCFLGKISWKYHFITKNVFKPLHHPAHSKYHPPHTHTHFSFRLILPKHWLLFLFLSHTHGIQGHMLSSSLRIFLCGAQETVCCWELNPGLLPAKSAGSLMSFIWHHWMIRKIPLAVCFNVQQHLSTLGNFKEAHQVKIT